MDVATDGVREARRARAPDSPVPGEGEGGWVFDEMGNLVEPTERPTMGEPNAGGRRDMDVVAGAGARPDCAATRGGLGRLAMDGVMSPNGPAIGELE